MAQPRSAKLAWPMIAGAFGVAILVGGALDAASVRAPDRATTAYAEAISGCAVTDGDTIRCGDERIRLLGIDAPEMPGHCRPGRDCVQGDPYASTSNLAAGMAGKLTIQRVGEDHYGRTLAMVAGSQGDLSCWQLKHNQVVYKAKWDNGLRVARACPGAVL
ncbi:endonuclease YncB(thermonuclease family) [Novosphingobium chloroacetimidivorans]|uniref:Endonuclease YncB(Thermonuclease family) n=1 Tax=Novosphingobium chloroacetimidivorans TaxID=1428314 RepID=A0A7W7NVK5_9SPHN|nr:thermonuclease family protein [Novosphingobium chloroacetimidivorans]MBB4857212.1 endonuclease YncB(thermonuclease family) [Novosphingobium chloroacetimidivorans]